MTIQDEFSSAFSTAFDAAADPVPPDPNGPCSWPVSYSACGECSALDDPADKAIFEAMAAAFLWNWTGGVYGECSVVLRPCRRNCPGADSTFWGFGPFPPGSALHGASWGPALIGGRWFNLTCGRCGDACSCDGSDALALPGPVASVEEVLIDGAVLDPSAYRVDNARFLVRLDGEAWPSCQSMGLATTEPGTWEITYTKGLGVPVGGQIAAGVLACELAKAACNDATCALPRRVQTITRQGVTIAMLDSFEDVDTGHTGIFLIDSWVASVTKAPRRSQVYSVDVPRPKHRTTTWP